MTEKTDVYQRIPSTTNQMTQPRSPNDEIKPRTNIRYPHIHSNENGEVRLMNGGKISKEADHEKSEICEVVIIRFKSSLLEI